METLQNKFLEGDTIDTAIDLPSFILTKEAVIKYYMEEDHTFYETINYFKTTRAKLYAFLKANNIVKDTTLYLNDYLATIDKEEFAKSYFADGLEACKKKFNIKNNAMLYKILKVIGQGKKCVNINDLISTINKDEFAEYYLEHSNKDIKQHFSINSKQLKKLADNFSLPVKRALVKDAAKLVSKDELIDYYITKNNSYADTKEYFRQKYNLENFPLDALLKAYDLSKLNYSKQLIIGLINNSKEPLTMHEIATKLNLGYCNTTHLIGKLGLLDKVNYDHSESSYEQEIKLFLQDLGIEYIEHDRSVLNGQEIDIYIPDKNIGIEFNGNYWHSDIYKTKQYHFEKSKAAKEAGIRLLHIWEYEWLNPEQQLIVKSIIKTATGKAAIKIFARNCNVKYIDNKTAEVFNNKNHLQQHRKAKITYGLFYNNELVQLMSFSNSKYNKNLQNENSWEIIRSCTKLNTVVVGGVNKLLKAFIKDTTPSYLFSYCDFNKFDGNGYYNMGFSFIGYTGPNMKWLLNKNLAVDRNPKNRKKLEELAIAKLWQAGSLKFELLLDGSK